MSGGAGRPRHRRRRRPLDDRAPRARPALRRSCRQSQVLIERFLASQLPAGAISHLNYAQKVAQMPMVLSLMVCTVTFPVVARALAEGDAERARSRVERDLALAACIVLLGTAAVIACAPADHRSPLPARRVHRPGHRGDRRRDAGVRAGAARPDPGRRAGPLLLLGGPRPPGTRSPRWPAGSPSRPGSGPGVDAWGVYGIAAANATGITVTALVLLAGMGPRSVPVSVRGVLHELSRPVRAALVATLAGALAADRCRRRAPRTPRRRAHRDRRLPVARPGPARPGHRPRTPFRTFRDPKALPWPLLTAARPPPSPGWRCTTPWATAPTTPTASRSPPSGWSSS